MQPNLLIKMLALIPLLFAYGTPVFSSDPVEEAWEDARVRVDAELASRGKGVSRDARQTLIAWRGQRGVREHAKDVKAERAGLLVEQRRLKAPSPILNQRMSLGEISGDVNGITPFGPVYRTQRIGKTNNWCFQFGEEDHIIIPKLIGDQSGVRVLAGQYGDVRELTPAECRKEFGFVPSCHPTRVLLLAPRKYADTGTGEPTLK